MQSVLAQLRQTLRRFRVARRGNVAITFALAAIPAIGFVGATIEYNQALAIKTEFQAALDSTALTLAKEAASVPATSNIKHQRFRSIILIFSLGRACSHGKQCAFNEPCKSAAPRTAPHSP